MNKVVLRRVDIEAIQNLMENLDATSVIITVDGSSGIGSIVTASIHTEVNGYDGEFTVVVADEENW
jgi:hypothetical protein